MNGTSELEHRSDAELRELADAPARAAAELARRATAAQDAAATDARAAAERWSLGNVRAIGGAASELDKTLARIAENPNRKDVAIANRIWALICERYEMAEVVVRRFPGIKGPATPMVLPPGRRNIDVEGLSIQTPRRQLFPVITAADTAALRDALYAVEAHAWLLGRGASLPEELRGAIAVAPPEPDFSELVERQRAERQRNHALLARHGV